MFVKKVIGWISPQNEPDMPDNYFKTCLEKGDGTKEEMVIDKNNTDTRENIDANLSDPKRDPKNAIITNFLEIKDTQNIYDKSVGPSGDFVYKLPKEPKLSPLCVRLLSQKIKSPTSESKNTDFEDRRTKRNIFTQTENKKDRNKSVGSSGDGVYKLPKEPKLSPLCVRLLNRKIKSPTSESQNTDFEDRRTKRNIFTQTENKKDRNKSVGSSGDGVYKLSKEPKLSPLCVKLLNQKIKSPRSEYKNADLEDRRTKRNIFTQTENKKDQRKVNFKASIARKSSSLSMIDKLNTINYDKENPCNRSPKSGSTYNFKSSKECLDNNAVKKLVKKTHFSNDIKQVVHASPDKKNIFIKSPNLGKRNLKSSVDKLQGFPPGKITQEGIIRSCVATLIREAVNKCHHEELDSNVYGELFVLGCDDGTSRLSNRFVLRRRSKASGVKEVSSVTYIPTIPDRKHTVSFQVSASRSVAVEYIHDTTTDMFQMGRHHHSPIDIHLSNINNGRKGISRFACRLVIQRHGESHQARIYAAAFDGSGNIFLGEEAIADFSTGGEMDGFTTNGVYILQPGGEWREVSVRGRLYPARIVGETTSSRRPLQEEENRLMDGTLIDLCGVTLMWRTREGLSDAPSEDSLNRMECLLKELAPESQRRNGPLTGELHWEGERRAYVFLSCGHVVTMNLRLKDSMDGWSCPECRCIGPVACLRVGRERGFYADKELPSHAFRPCGHVTTLRTVKYWSSVAMPPHRNVQEKGVCPFCATKLHNVIKYVGLIYPE
ncbi:hypothetical protein JTE90_007496 [Oedothorax gibbosus]|uniref:Protein pellino n=1 Tax=Oedothorax gibbosus TaxID=931172 RepID=A0AAV6VMV2_9ARAC|nr:hypothetical protein JTE90_007496 [Oedothorax gibbosus]